MSDTELIALDIAKRIEQLEKNAYEQFDNIVTNLESLMNKVSRKDVFK